MPPPLTADGQVTYAPGNPAPTVNQMAKDVAAFLVWTAEPKLNNRHGTGLAVVIFLLVASALGYGAYRNIWATEKRKVRVTGALDPKNQAKSAAAKGKAGIEG
jgi:ubiquinol-cytochrome c reductase cytochrome c1 subunit